MRLGLVALVLLFTFVDSTEKIPEERVYRVSLGPGMDPFLQSEVMDGLREWEQDAPHLHFEVVFTPCHEEKCVDIVPVTLKYLRENHVYNPEHPTIGWTNREQRPIRVEIASEVMFPVRNYVVRHEIGHVLGLGHGDKQTIMFWESSGASVEITCADVREYCKAQQLAQVPCHIGESNGTVVGQDQVHSQL